MTRKTFLSIGSGPGIGIATARRFAREGFNLVLAARNANRLEAQAAVLRAEGAQVETRSVDAVNVTVSRLVSPDSPHAPEIAEAFWQLHAQPAGRWTLDTVYS